MIASITWNKFVAWLHRLYEQKKTEDNALVILGDYVRRCRQCVGAGLDHEVHIKQYGCRNNRNNTPHPEGVQGLLLTCWSDRQLGTGHY